MAGLRAWLRSFAEATVDVGLSVFGLLLVLGPTASALNRLLGTPLAESYLSFALVIGAVVLAYPFANRWLSQGWLGTYVLAFWGGLIASGLVGGAVLIALGTSLSGENPLWPALLIAQGHAVACTITYLDDVSLVPSSGAEPCAQ